MHWNVGTAADQTEFLSPGQPFGYLIKICSLISGESDGVKQAKNENWRCEGGRLEMKMDGEGWVTICTRVTPMCSNWLFYLGCQSLGSITLLKFLLCARYFVILTRFDMQDTGFPSLVSLRRPII